MLEAQPIHGVGELDVDAEVVGIELELIALEQRRLLVDVHAQGRDLAVDRKLPVPVFRRIGLEIDPVPAVAQFALCVGHGVFLTTSFIPPRDWRDRPRGDRAAGGWRSRKSPAASPRAIRDKARAACSAAAPPRPDSSTPPAPPRSAAPCRTGPARPAR